jgi:hypothetical protein
VADSGSMDLPERLMTMVSSSSVFVNRLPPRAVSRHEGGEAACAAGRERTSAYRYRASGGDRGVAALAGCPPKMLVAAPRVAGVFGLAVTVTLSWPPNGPP